MNLALLVFKLIRRVLRALLATRLDYLRASQIAASTGQALAFGFSIWGRSRPRTWAR